MSIPTDAAGITGARRFDLLPVENLTPGQRALYDAIRSGPRAKIAISGASKPGPLGGPFNVWLRSPGIGDCVQRLGEEIRFRSTLPSKLNEMAIMVTARFWTSQYEWYAHCKLALNAGLDPAIANDIAEGRRPANMDADESATRVRRILPILLLSTCAATSTKALPAAPRPRSPGRSTPIYTSSISNVPERPSRPGRTTARRSLCSQLQAVR